MYILVDFSIQKMEQREKEEREEFKVYNKGRFIRIFPDRYIYGLPLCGKQEEIVRAQADFSI